VLTSRGETPVPIDGLRAVFANYVLDVLPAAVVRFVDDRTEHLCVRTLIEDEQEMLRANTELDRAAIESLARAEDPVEALKECPNNWCVLGEVAECLMCTGQPSEGMRLAALALRRNPWYSPWLWNTLGAGSGASIGMSSQ
jgi:hypothetical protein